MKKIISSLIAASCVATSLVPYGVSAGYDFDDDDDDDRNDKDDVVKLTDVKLDLPEKKISESVLQSSAEKQLVNVLYCSEFYKKCIKYAQDYAELFLRLYSAGDNEEDWSKYLDVLTSEIDASIPDKVDDFLKLLPESVSKKIRDIWELETRKIPTVKKQRDLMSFSWGKGREEIYKGGTDKGKRLSEFLKQQGIK